MQVGFNLEMEKPLHLDTLAHRVREARLRSKLTQVQLSERSGVAQADISKVENGRNPNPSFLLELAAALGVSPYWLKEGGEQAASAAAIPLDNNPDYPAVRRARIKASAGTHGYAIEDSGDSDAPPIVFRASWFKTNGYRPERMVALRVCGQSMEPTLFEDDLIVVNTDQPIPKDGRVFVVIYEGVVAVKRLVRDAGAWWLESDNADKRTFPRKACTDETTVVVGEVVYKQSERI